MYIFFFVNFPRIFTLTSYQVPVVDSSCHDPRQRCLPSLFSPESHSCLATIFYPQATGPSHTTTTIVHRQPQPTIHTLSYTSYHLRTVNNMYSPLISGILSFSGFILANLSGMNSLGPANNYHNFHPIFELLSFSL